MYKEDVVHIYNGILLSHKMNEIISFAATCMDLKIRQVRAVLMSDGGWCNGDKPGREGGL